MVNMKGNKIYHKNLFYCKLIAAMAVFVVSFSLKASTSNASLGNALATSHEILVLEATAPLSPPPADPSNVITCEGGTATFSVSGFTNYQWQQNNGSGWVSLNGAISSTLTISLVPLSSNGYQYRCLENSTPSGAATLTVNPKPVVTNSSTAEICSGSSPGISLTSSTASTFSWIVGATTGNISGANAGSGSVINDILTNSSNTSVGTVAYLVTPTSTTGLCAGSTFTITVSVDPIPVVTVSNTSTICSGSATSLDLIASVTSNFSWTVGAITGGITGASSGSGATIAQILTNPSNLSSGSVTYVVTPTSTLGSCIGAPFNILVTVLPTPAVTTHNIATICSGNTPSINLTASISSSFIWSIGTIVGGITGGSSGSGTTIDQLLTNPNSPVGGTIEYLVTPTSTAGSCVGASYPITVTVNPTPTITNSPTVSACSGSSPYIILSATAPSNYTWIVSSTTGGITGASNGSGSIINQILTNPSKGSVGTVTYVVTPTAIDGSCTGNPFTITVNVNPTPIITTSNTATICNGTGPNINLAASVPSTFSWTIGTITGGITGARAGSGGLINQMLYNPDIFSSGSVAYIVTPQSIEGSCSGTSFIITVFVNPGPVLTSANIVEICSGTGPDLALTASVPSTFTWTVGSTTGGIAGASDGSGPTINQTLTNTSHSSAGTVTYDVTPTSTSPNLSCASFPVTIIVEPLPIVLNPSTTTICSGTSADIFLNASTSSNFSWTIGAISGGITGANTGSGPTISDILTNPSNISSGYVDYIVTPRSVTGSCVGLPFTIRVTVNPKPAVTTSNSADICSGSAPNISLLATAPSSFAWTINSIVGGIMGSSSGSGSTINQILTNPSNTTAGSVEYLVTPTSLNGSCSGTPYSIVVTVEAAPKVLTSNQFAICTGLSPNISLTSSIPSTFTWTVGAITQGIAGAVGGSGSSINQILTNPSSLLSGTVNYIVTPKAIATGCIGAPYTITVTVNPRPIVTNVSTASTCSGTSPNITLTSNIPSTFTWIIGAITGGITGATSGNGSSIDQVLTSPNSRTTGTVQYIITPTSAAGSCGGTPYTITVTVNPTPEVTTINTATICSGSGPNLALTSLIPSNYSWTVNTNTGAISGSSLGSGSTLNQILTNPSSTLSGLVEYLVTPVSIYGTCAGAPYSLTINVNPAIVVTNASSTTICSGDSPNINLTSSLPSNFTWSVGTITGGITGAAGGSGSLINQNLINPSNAVSGTVEYVVTPKSTANGCAGLPYSIIVTVNPKPLVTNSAAAIACSGSGFNLPLSATVPSSFTWTIGAISGGITGASNGSGATINQVLTNPSITVYGTVEYIVTPTSLTGSCSGTPFRIVVTVNSAPIVTNSNSALICSGSAPNITLAASESSSFSWTIGTITGAISGASAGSGPILNQILINPSNTAIGSVDYIVTPTSTAGSCSGTPFTITISVRPAQTVTTASTAAVCSGTSTNILLTASIPSTFTWSVGAITGGITGATIGSGSTIGQVLTNPSNTRAGTVEYIVTPISITNSCTGSPYTITVTVNPKPIGTNANATTCSGTSPNVVLTASVPSTFTWTIGAITGGITGASPGSGVILNQKLTNPSNTSAGTVAYLVTPTATTGICAGTPYTITVTVNPTPTVTNSSTASSCSGAGPNISLTSSAPSNFSWTIGTISGNITGAGSGSGAIINQALTNPSNTIAGTVEYIVTPTSIAGSCSGSPYTITVTVNPATTVTNAPNISTCSGSSPNLTLTASTPSSFTWAVGTITGNITGASNGAGPILNQILTNPSTTTAGTVAYIVTPIATTGTCAGAPYTIVVTVNPKSIITNTAAITICNGTGPNIALAASVSSTFTWTVGLTTGGITGASAGSGNTINQILTNPSNTIAGTVDYIVTPIAATGGCTGIPFTITVTVTPAPAVTNIGTSSTCSGVLSNIALTASMPSSFTWTIGAIIGNITGPSAGAGSTINQTLINPSNATAGTVEYLVTPTSIAGSCTGTPSKIAVTVNPATTVTNASTASTCSGTSPNLTLTASTPSSFTWAVGTITGNITGASNGAGPILNQILTNPSTTTAGTVAYIVTPIATTGTCAGTPYTIVVTVNPKPIVTNVATASTCTGSGPNIALTASVPSSFTWTIGMTTGGITGASAGSGNTINQILTNPNNAIAGTVDYIITPIANNGGCAGIPFIITVTVNPAPLVTNLATISVCNGVESNIPLTSSMPSSFTWTIGTITGAITGPKLGAGSAITQTLINPSNTTAGTVEYLITTTSLANGCVNSIPKSIVLAVQPTPLVSITADTPNPVCERYPLTLKGPIGMASYSWNGPNGFTSAVFNPQIASVSRNSAGLYTLTIVDKNGCSNSSTYNLTVSAVDASGFNGIYGTYCISDMPVTLSAYPAGGTFVGTGVTGNKFNPLMAGAGTFPISYVAPGGCIVAQITVLVVTTAVVKTVGQALPNCTSTIDLTAPSVTAGSTPGLLYTYWKDAAATIPLTNPQSVVAGTYFIKGSLTSGTCSAITPVFVAPSNNLMGRLTIVAPTCPGSATGTMTAIITKGKAPYNYQWDSTPVQNSATATKLVAGVYSVTITDASGCSTIITDTLKDPQTVKIIFAHKNIECLNDFNGSARVDRVDSLNRKPSDVNLYTYKWNATPVQTTREAVKLASGYYTVTMTSAKGCELKDSVLISVTDTTPPTIKCPTDINQIITLTSGNKPFLSGDNSILVDLGQPIVWDNCGIRSVINDAPAKFKIGITEVIWTVTDFSGLTDTCTQKVTLRALPEAPQLFSPNGDGVNDKFEITGIEQFQKSQLYVYTRSGQLVYSSEDYQNDWDGRFTTSGWSKKQIVAPGVYYYILNLGDSIKKIQGFVYINY
jgi:gliding motility-associated-like protein